MQEYNIYCDESCHLPFDNQTRMVLGAVWCRKDKAHEIFNKIRALKKKHGLSPYFEIKWTKVSKAKIGFYIELMEYFFKENDLNFRAVIADKTRLKHEIYEQDHEKWYYKMYFYLLDIFNPRDSKYYIYVDIKDTCGQAKIKELHNILCNSYHDFDKKIIDKIQIVHSNQVEIIQLADFLAGALCYKSRSLTTSFTKNIIIEKIKELSGYSLTATTLLKEEKFNLFFWIGK